MSLGYQVKRITSKDYEVEPNVISLFESINNIKYNKKQLKFKEWLNSGVFLDDYNENDYITNLDRVNDFTNSIISIIKENGFVIKNERNLKNELASFIYKLS